MTSRIAASHTVPAALLTAAFVLAYGSVLVALAGQWATDPNYAYGFFVPPMAAWLAWRRRDAFRRAPRASSALGLGIVAAGGLLFVAGVVAAELFTTRVSVVVVAAGLILALEGRERLRVMAFPVAFLLFMVPLPYVLYYRLTFPLQLLSTRLAASFLGAMGMALVRDGNLLHLEGYSLEVVTACSGLRSIMSLGAVGVFMLDALAPAAPARLAGLLLIIPIAVMANVARLIATASIAAVAGPEMADGFLHEFSGLVVFLTGLAALALASKGIQWIARGRRGSRH